MSKSLIISVLLLVCGLEACVSRTYLIQPAEANRVSAGLKVGETAVVEATNRAGQVVHIRLEPGDSLEVLREKVPAKKPKVFVEAGEIAELPTDTAALKLTHRNKGPIFVGLSGAMAAAALVVGIASRPTAPPCSDDDLCAVGRGFDQLAYVLEVALLSVGSLAFGFTGVFLWDSGSELVSSPGLTFAPTVFGDGQVGGVLSGRF